MFNMATKLLLSLVISAEHANTLHIKVKLGTSQKGTIVCLTDNNWWQGIFDEDSFDADCPLDSRILDKIGISKTKWSKIGNGYPISDYGAIQGIIRSKTIGCNLLFDFENWN